LFDDGFLFRTGIYHYFITLPEPTNLSFAMKKLLWLCLCLPYCGLAQLTVNITYAYQYTPLADTLFLSGTFNAWAVNNPGYMFSRTGINTFQLIINPPAGSLQFKVTRGSWSFVEANSGGGTIANRTYTYSGSPSTLNLQINGWQDIGGDGQATTAASNVYLLDTDFPLPQLNTSRRIWVYLPPDYYTSQKQYPVLYMEDGQNLFDQTLSSNGEWKVDESLNALYNQGDYGIVVVGIDNGSVNRLNEYSPWVNPSYGGGQGAPYMNWLEHNLKPYIDKNFRTYNIPKYTGLMGSSMGALISQFGAVQYSQTFKKVGLLSPSFWFTDTIFQQVHNLGVQPDMKFYFVSGTTEDSSMVPLMMAMRDSVVSKGLNVARTKLLTWADGQHAEWFWSREFPAAYQWLFNDLNTTTSAGNPPPENRSVFDMYPNPASESVYLYTGATKWQIQLLDMLGKIYISKRIHGPDELNTTFLPDGVYVLEARSEDGCVERKKLFVHH
jgi:predicted alpha/beta superfamily hydrolase